MARGRMISACLSTSRKYASLQQTAGKLAEFAQALYPLVVVHCDDFGRMAGDGWSVKYQAHPASPRSLDDFETALAAMETSGLIIRYDDENGGKCLSVIEFEAHQTGLHKRTSSKFPEPPGISRNVPAIPSEEKRREEKGTEGKGREGSAERVATLPPLAEAWNQITSPPIPRCREASDERKRKLAARQRERSLDTWTEVFTRVQASSFCRGENDRGWVASLDWIVANSTNAAKVLEGKYDDPACPPEVAAVRDAWIATYAEERNGAAYPAAQGDTATWMVLARTYSDLEHLGRMMRFFLRASDLPEWAMTRTPNAFLRLAPETDAAVRGAR